MKQKNLKLFFIHEALFYFSDSMLVIVLPIFVYKLFGAPSAIFAFSFIWNLIYLCLFIPIFNKAMLWGKPKYFMILGVILYISAQIMFGKTTPEHRMLIIPATLLYALYVSFYWMVRHWFFSVNADFEKIGKQISYLGIIRLMIGFIAPIIGGWLSFFVSFNATFILGSLAGLLSIIPILFFNAPPHPRGYDWKKVRKILKKPELRAIRPAYFWEGVSMYSIGTCWILAFTIFIGNIKEFGTLVGVTTLIAVILTRLSGHMFDKGKRVKILTKFIALKTIGIFMYASVFFYPTMVYAWGVELFNRFATNLHQTFIDSYLFGYSSKIHPIHFHLNREVHISIARVMTSGSLAIIFYFIPVQFLWLSIFIGAFTTFGWLSLKHGEPLLKR
jgi:MFS family permease